VLTDQGQQLVLPTPLNSKDFDSTVTLEDAKDEHLACGSPTPFPLAFTAKHCFIALKATLKRLLAIFGKSQHAPTQMKEALGRFSGSRRAEAQPISRDSEYEEFQQATLMSFAQAARLPDAAKALAVSAAATFTATIRELPEPVMTALTTLSFHSPSVPDFSPV
jgi:hypothetical protein